MTTAVECIWEISEDSIIFETRNTKYYLKYYTVPNETEVMCLTTYELGSSLEKLLYKLKKNRENVLLDILKTYYKVPYRELISQITQTVSGILLG